MDGLSRSECIKSPETSYVSSRGRSIRLYIGSSDAGGLKRSGDVRKQSPSQILRAYEARDTQLEVEKDTWEKLTAAVARVLEAV